MTSQERDQSKRLDSLENGYFDIRRAVFWLSVSNLALVVVAVLAIADAWRGN